MCHVFETIVLKLLELTCCLLAPSLPTKRTAPSTARSILEYSARLSALENVSYCAPCFIHNPSTTLCTN